MLGYCNCLGYGFLVASWYFKIHLFILFKMIMETVNQQETKWYVLRVVSGKERKVKEYLDKEISRVAGVKW